MIFSGIGKVFKVRKSMHANILLVYSFNMHLSWHKPGKNCSGISNCTVTWDV